MPTSARIICKLAMMVQCLYPNCYGVERMSGQFRTPLLPANLRLIVSRHRAASSVPSVYPIVAWGLVVYTSGDLGDLFTHSIPLQAHHQYKPSLNEPYLIITLGLGKMTVFSMLLNMRSIKRIHPTSDETPPWAGMAFTQPLDSDALHELLKSQYPQCTSMRQRKHLAAIDFLNRELESMQNEAMLLQASHPGPEELDVCKHQRSLSPSLSHSNSYRSPALVEHHPQQSPTITKIATGQQHVFSIVDGGLAVQPKKKRKMTPAERSAYKTTRKIGACDKCKRQKGKCTHVIATLMPVGKTLRDDDITLQRPEATLPATMATHNDQDLARARKDAKDLSQSVTAPSSPHWAQETQGIQQGNQSEISGSSASTRSSSSEASSPITSTTSLSDSPETTVTTPTATSRPLE